MADNVFISPGRSLWWLPTPTPCLSPTSGHIEVGVHARFLVLESGMGLTLSHNGFVSFGFCRAVYGSVFPKLLIVDLNSIASLSLSTLHQLHLGLLFLLPIPFQSHFLILY